MATVPGASQSPGRTQPLREQAVPIPPFTDRHSSVCLLVSGSFPDPRVVSSRLGGILVAHDFSS